MTGMLIMSLFFFPIFFTSSVFLIPVSIPPALLPFLLSLYEPCISHLNSFGSHFSVFFSVFQFCPHFCQVYDIKFLYIFPEVLVFISYSQHSKKIFSVSFFHLLLCHSSVLGFFRSYRYLVSQAPIRFGFHQDPRPSLDPIRTPLDFRLPHLQPVLPLVTGGATPPAFFFYRFGLSRLGTYFPCLRVRGTEGPSRACLCLLSSFEFFCLSFLLFSIFYSVDL